MKNYLGSLTINTIGQCGTPKFGMPGCATLCHGRMQSRNKRTPVDD
ncbi:MAG: hypothetical protein ABIQ02_12610 [Saprospiraceae bacterium]